MSFNFLAAEEVFEEKFAFYLGLQFERVFVMQARIVLIDVLRIGVLFKIVSRSLYLNSENLAKEV